jgi:uncharacterized protein YoxC
LSPFETVPAAAEPLALIGALASGFGPFAAAIQVVEPTGWRLWLVTLADIATVVIALALLVTGLVLMVIALQVRKLIKKVDPLLSQVKTHVDPLMGHARDVGENVNYMSSAIRADVQQVTELVDATRRRLNRTADATEQRIREFNALLGVMQEEAERIFISTASAARGVRVGTEAYRARTDSGGRDAEIRIEPKRGE